MTKLASPRRLAFRGTIEVFAWGFPRSLVPPEELPGRVLALWQSGARFEEFTWGHVLFLRGGQKVRVEVAPTLVLTRDKGRLIAAPLSQKDELDAGTWVVEDGEWHALTNGQVVDVSSWLDVGAWEVPVVTSLGEVPEMPTAIAPVELDLRAQSGIAAPDEKWQTIWERGEKGALTKNSSPFSPSHLFGFLSGLFTPRSDVGDLPVASNRSIALSGIFVLGSAVLFLLQSWSDPMRANIAPMVVMFGLLMVWALRRSMTRGRHDNLQKEIAPPVVVSPAVRSLSLLLVALGVIGIALSDVGHALNALFTIVIVLVLSRVLGIAGSLVGRRAVGVGTVSGTEAGIGGARGGGWLARWLARSEKTGTSGNKTRDDISDALRRVLANAALRSGLFKTLGRAQARYLLRSMEMFERGDLEAALRHAIPLGGKMDGEWEPPPSLSLPGARSELGLSLANLPARGTFNFGPEVQERLRALYRSAFEKLRDAGEIHKAAFVLADLLQNVEEAVEFLEKHREFELAAKLAEGRELEPGLVVRAWWLAGNRKRAIQIAQLKEAFADAIVRLEKSPENREDAAALRLLWGHHLAGLGRFDAAVEAVWSIPQGLPFASQWLRVGLKENVSSLLLARAVAREPECWEEWRPFIETLLQEEKNANGTSRRARFASALDSQKGEANPALAVAARLTVRALLRDGANEWGGVPQPVWNGLMALAGDGLLRVDSRWNAPTRKTIALAQLTEAIEITVNGEGGTLNARDAVLLENGELLVALGEMGARLLSWDGRVKAQFDVPAHSIVRAFDAPRALLLAPRDDSWRVTKLDLSRRKAQLWGDIRASCFARQFDGATWFVGSEGRVRAFDVASATPSALWDSGDMGGEPVDLALSHTSLAALVEKTPPDSFTARGGTPIEEASFESWRFELPSLVLRLRMAASEFSTLPWLGQRQINEHGGQFSVGLDDGSLFFVKQGSQFLIGTTPHQVFGAVMGTLTAVFWQDDRGVLVSFLLEKSESVVARVRFKGAAYVGGRECDGVWVLWDDLGRVATFNPTYGNIEVNWVLS